MFLFIENLAGLHIASHSPELSRRRLVKFVTPYVVAFAGPALREYGLVIVLPHKWMRLLKPLLSVTQLPIIQQDPNSWAFRLSFWRHVLSDGLLTEFLVRQLNLRVRRFYSLSTVASENVTFVSGCAIIGSNWVEFGSMTHRGYLRHLQFLKQRYPEATYYCHPKERNRIPEQVFGAAFVRRPNQPVETLLRANGVPRLLVGVCSSSLLVLAAGNANRVQVDLIAMPAEHFDGRRGDTIELLQRPIAGCTRVSVGDLQEFLFRELTNCNVQAKWIDQTTSSLH